MNRQRPLQWTTIGVVVLAVLALGLSVFALRASRGTPNAGASTTPTSLPTGPTNSTGTTPTPSLAPSASTTTSGTLGSGLSQRMQPALALTGRTAFRATNGTCTGGAPSTVLRTSDSGRTWQAVGAPASAVLTLSAAGGQISSIASAAPGVSGGDCTPGKYVLSGRRSWTGPDASVEDWYREPNDPTKLHTPAGDVLSPCRTRTIPVIQLAAIGPQDAAVLCNDGDVFRTRDSGNQWARLSVVHGAIALAWESRSLGWLIVAGGPHCVGLATVRTLDGGSTWQRAGCVGTLPLILARRMPVAVDFDGPQRGMAAIGDRIYTTHDGGLSWQPA